MTVALTTILHWKGNSHYYLKDSMKLFLSYGHSFCITWIYHVDDCLCVWVIASPIRSATVSEKRWQENLINKWQDNIENRQPTARLQPRNKKMRKFSTWCSFDPLQEPHITWLDPKDVANWMQREKTNDAAARVIQNHVIDAKQKSIKWKGARILITRT